MQLAFMKIIMKLQDTDRREITWPTEFLSAYQGTL